MDGTWKSEDTWDGIAKGMVTFPEYSADVPDDVKAAADVVRDGIADGSLNPFQGPIFNQAGKEILAEGEVYDDKTLLGMNFYVQGVQGELPK
jgi:simple sugar transport system substrate-binding protein